MVSVGMKPPMTMDVQDNAPNESTPHARQANISTLWPIQKQRTLSPTIEESLSPRVGVLKLDRGNKTTPNIADDFTEKVHSVSSDARPGRVHGSNYVMNSGRPEIVENRSINDTGNIISSTVSSPGKRKTGKRSPTKSLIQLNTALSMPRLDTGIDGKTAVLEGSSQLQSLPSHHGCYDVAFRNGGLSRSITDPQMGEEDRSVPIRSADPSLELSGIRDRTNRDGKSFTRSSADQWRTLVASSTASKESLAKSARERRLKRGSDPMLSRTSREAPILAQPRPTTPEWKRRFMQIRSEPAVIPTMVQPERKCISEETPQRTSLTPRARFEGPSPDKYCTNTPYRQGSQRSASKPMPGAIKAMAALFDDGARVSPGRSATMLSKKARPNLRESNSFPRRDVVDESPNNSNLSRENPAPTESPGNIDEHPHRNKAAETFVAKDHSPVHKGPRSDRTAPHQPSIEDSRVKSLRAILRPANMFSSARKEPQFSPTKPAADVDRTQPPRLGTIVPHQEEPPVGHFVRPSSSASAQSLHPSAEGVSAPLDGPGHASGNNSLLHAQIRSLQRQLETKNGTTLQLRRQLETQENMDIGTLCEQLRLARRECTMWRKRAEAAERRVAVLQRLGAKFRALADEDGDGDGDSDGALGGRELGGDGGWDEDESESGSCSGQTESRIRRAGGDGAVFKDGDEETDTVCARRGCELRRRRRRPLDLQRDESFRG